MSKDGWLIFSLKVSNCLHGVRRVYSALFEYGVIFGSMTKGLNSD